MRKKGIKHKISGFSLIEMAVVLTVIGMIAGSALMYSAAALEAKREKDTKERIAFVFKQLQHYVDTFQQLPCPADPFLSISDNDYGFGLGTGNEPPALTDPIDFTPGGFPCDPSNGGAVQPLEQSDNPGGPAWPAAGYRAFIMGGMIPVNTLRLAPKYALDGWGRRMHYAVDQNLTWIGPGGAQATADGQGGFTDRCRTGNIIIRKKRAGGIPFEITRQAAVLILSYGSNGHGAWLGRGGNRLDKGSTNIDEKNNGYNGNGVSQPGIPYDQTFIQKYATGYSSGVLYDDIVEYRTKWQFDPQYAYPWSGDTNCDK